MALPTGHSAFVPFSLKSALVTGAPRMSGRVRMSPIKCLDIVLDLVELRVVRQDAIVTSTENNVAAE